MNSPDAMRFNSSACFCDSNAFLKASPSTCASSVTGESAPSAAARTRQGEGQLLVLLTLAEIRLLVSLWYLLLPLVKMADLFRAASLEAALMLLPLPMLLAHDTSCFPVRMHCCEGQGHSLGRN